MLFTKEEANFFWLIERACVESDRLRGEIRARTYLRIESPRLRIELNLTTEQIEDMEEQYLSAFGRKFIRPYKQ